MHTHLINNNRQLAEVCDILAQAEWITLDTEFMRERTYYPQLCLIQAGHDGRAWCIDALADIDLDIPVQLICQSGSTRVLHAARQDLEIFFHHYGSFESPLFDTQIAAGLLGYDAQIGYAGLIKQVTGKELEKGYQRANWANRPLPEAQLEYALDDVRYLAQVYPILLDKLQHLGRLDWALEDSARLHNRDLYITDPELAYQRIGQMRALPAVEQQVVRQLAKWREHLAQQTDRPRNWVASDNTLIYLAQVKPDSMTRLKKVKGIAPELIEMHGEKLLTSIAHAIDNPENKLMTRPEPLTDAEQKLYKQLKQRLDQLAKSLGVEAPVLGTRKDVELLLRGNGGSQLLHGWRKQLVGNDLEAMC